MPLLVFLCISPCLSSVISDKKNTEHIEALLEERLHIVLEEKLKAVFEDMLNAILDNKLMEIHLSMSKLAESSEEVKNLVPSLVTNTTWCCKKISL